MKSRETIMDMFKQFSNLVNDLKGFGKRFETIELVKKILRSLPDAWSMKVTTIEESKDLNTVGMDESIGDLWDEKET